MSPKATLDRSAKEPRPSVNQQVAITGERVPGGKRALGLTALGTEPPESIGRELAGCFHDETWTGVPVSASSEPACEKNTSGISSWDGECANRTAITTTTGSSAATAR